ncbi:NAD-dependent succinate-semialdehyde dehydrogenase [Terricaulis silvestris]|uniref:Succinate-semialdehyde dehydrogenase [NADP(+)] GabD n=1 Tax=Terricaulis silvestris TaxID=2686094 RepID=A0A6I6MFP8_9CAUL|nr:NAD-dependent succinate-semialdehyde dehydrogenase [Terricaulis silvestris]QGZ93300.1 Succinate-semialdehyde dehydrogenase [NADP(+)] GabD [Terricaulis silvestris]
MATSFRQDAYINGQWRESAKRFDVLNPANQEVIARVPDLGARETEEAIAAAHAAFPAWAAKPAKERVQILRAWFDLMMADIDRLARLISLEGGKPVAEAKGEAAYGASFMEWFGEEAKRAYGRTIPTTTATRRYVTIKQPIGVCAAITPWNFPMAMITRKAAPAIAAGNTIVLKPPSQTPLTALALAELAEKAGVPKGVFNVVTTHDHTAEIGKAMCESPLVRKFSFTGSTEVGKKLGAACVGSTVKRLSLELGGNAPLLVFADADLDLAVKGTVMSKFRNAGQTCVCANRILVEDSIYDAFSKKLTEAVAKLKVGPGDEAGVEIGPLIDAKAIEKVERMVAEALASGATALTGGNKHAAGAQFYTPTVLANVTKEMRVNREEIFGPVAPLIRFKTEDEAVDIANATEFGLAAYFFTKDVNRAWRVAERIDAGMVSINDGIFSNEVIPFGGVKESGLGREGGVEGLEEYLETKFVNFGGFD